MNSNLGNKETMSKNLNRYIALSGKERKDIAKDLNISYSTLTDWINGNTYPRIDKIEMLANYFGIMKADLVEENYLVKESTPEYSITRQIPILGQIAAGLPLLAEENIENYFNIDKSIHADFILRIKGTSMIGAGIMDGDLAFIRTQPTVENGEIAAVLIDDDTATLKTVYYENGIVRLVSENPEYPTKIFDKGGLRIMGKLVAVLNVR